ncbi:MAG TPA: FAD-binding protein [Kofleriaceae bacterium]|nr:FAD-binding protein [Kofleriaceae bacterium]
MARLALAITAALTACSSPPPATPSLTPLAFCKPSQPCWPAAADWQALAAQLTGKLERPTSPLAACDAAPTSEACAAALRTARNPFFLEDQVGGTQQAGWLNAWEPRQSVYAIVAETAGDVAAGVKFAAAHQLRLAIKGTGHDYLGRSSAPDSLLIWTHHMRKVDLADAFVPHGCPATTPAVSTVTVGAGARWLEAYQAVTVEHGRYVQGGGCTSVGAAGGFLQGGGFGSWSKKYGTGAAGLVEAEVVTADGQTVIANACQHADLFWALRGGGGGTFGVVTKATLLTHPLPTTFGAVHGTVTAANDAAFRDLIGHFVTFYRDQLNNEHWGESVNFSPKNELEISMAFEGLSEAEAAAVWQPLRAWIESQPALKIALEVHAVPASKMWSYDFFHQYAADAIQTDDRPGAPHGQYWWSGDAEQVHTYWYAYESRWLPVALFQPAQSNKLADALFAASRQAWFALHFNKGLAGGAPDALARTRDTATNPAVLDAAALYLTGALGDVVPGVPGHDLDRAKAEARRAKVTAATKIIRDLTPGAGSYVNETSFFEPDWQHAFWGTNYEKLLAIKRKYDPRGLFVCHHCVGSEASGI